ncbi:MAG: AAA family ATPase [Planctomycetaceae bacterium]|nr:AAA family ATPase [Planctomycetaceae bacterium]
MYEDFFQLKKRPFAPVGPVDSFITVGPFQKSFDLVQRSLKQGQSILLLVGPPGSGKSHFCRFLASSVGSNFKSLYLNSSGLHTRRALLQAVLHALGREYVGLSEQESRLQILEAARQLQDAKRHLLLIFDEAHLLSPKLCEELRTLCDQSSTEEQQIQLILAGIPELEELLFHPELATFNQRVGAHVVLEPLTLQESADYLIQRFAWAGAEDIELVMDEDALELICRVSDGNMRCLTQLADHSLLVSFVDEVQPVSRDQVLKALQDLKVLPLPFQTSGIADAETLASLGAAASPPRQASSDSDITDEWVLDIPSDVDIPIELDDEETGVPISGLPSTTVPPLPTGLSVLEVGAEMALPTSSLKAEEVASSADVIEEAIAETIDEPLEELIARDSAATEDAPSLVSPSTVNSKELFVDDHYAILDEIQGWTNPEPGEEVFAFASQVPEIDLSPLVDSVEVAAAESTDVDDDLEQQLLDAVTEMRDEIKNAHPPVEIASTLPAESTEHDWLEYDIVQPLTVEPAPTAASEVQRMQPKSVAEEKSTSTRIDQPQQPSIYALLFERLRWRRRKVANEENS